MAAGDYRSCDVCGCKAFYDANLNYETGDKVDGKWVYSDTPFRVAGESQGAYGNGLDYVGDWAVICTDCAKTYRTAIVAVSLGNSVRNAALDQAAAIVLADCVNPPKTEYQHQYNATLRHTAAQILKLKEST